MKGGETRESALQRPGCPQSCPSQSFTALPAMPGQLGGGPSRWEARASWLQASLGKRPADEQV